MKAVIGYVANQTGNVSITGENGVVRALAKHMPVREGDMITSSTGASAEVVLDNGNVVHIEGENKIVLDESVYGKGAEGTTVSAEDIASLLEQTGDLEDLEAPAAGETVAGTSTLEVNPFISHTENLGGADAEVVGTLHGTESHAGVIDSTDVAVLSIDGPSSIAEGESGMYTLTLSSAAQTDMIVSFTYSGVATDGEDFTGVASVIIPAGQNSATFSIDTIADTLHEGDEPFTITIDSFSGGGFGVVNVGPALTTTIVDNDYPSLSVSDVTVDEGGAAVFTVTLGNESTQEVSVDFATADGTATAGLDYTAVAGTLTFAPGETEKTVTVQTTADTVYEGNESFTLALSNAANAGISDDLGLGTIVDDEVPPTLLIEGGSAAEGSHVYFNITLSGESDEDVSFTLNTQPGTATETDYGSMEYYNEATASWEAVAADGSLTIAAGSTGPVMVRVATVLDEENEESENFTLKATEITNTANATADAVGTITDVDPFILNVEITSNSNVETQVLRLTYTNADNPEESYTTLLNFDSEGQSLSEVHIFAFDVGFAIDPVQEYNVELQWVSGPTTQITDMYVEGVEIVGQTEKAYLSHDIKNPTDDQGYLMTVALIPSIGVTQEYAVYEDNSLTNDVLVGSVNNDTLTGAEGNDTLYGEAGADDMDGGAGEDTATYFDSQAGVTVNLATGTGTGGDAEGDTLSNIENVIGSDDKDESDTLIGDDNGNILMGLAGDDVLQGGGGSDTLDGGRGADTLEGGAGDDTLLYDAADTLIDGGEGNDTLIFSADTVLDFSQVASGSITNIEQIDLSLGSHVLDNLSVEDVVSMTGGNELTILGDSASSVNLLNESGSDWQSGGTVNIDGRYFNVYTDPTATIVVNIEQDINDTII